MPVQVELRKLSGTAPWSARFANLTISHSSHTADFYYDILCHLTAEIDLWETRYFHLMNSHSDIVKWYSGSGLRPYLDRLTDQPSRTEFVNSYENMLKGVYPVQADGRILFPFTRIFFMARA